MRRTWRQRWDIHVHLGAHWAAYWQQGWDFDMPHSSCRAVLVAMPTVHFGGFDVPRLEAKVEGRALAMSKRKVDNPIEDAIWPPHASRRCGAKARSTGQPCLRWAAIGHTRCKFHGGAKGSGRPQVHGKYSEQRRRQESALRVARHLLRHFHGTPTSDSVE